MIIPVNDVKHPLQNEWSFWLFTSTKRKWEENLVELTSFNTIEDYWCLYHHMKLPSELSKGQDYAIFKKGIRPMWEDPSNRTGGRWQIQFDNLRHGVMDSMWLDTVLLLIGENFMHSDIICGVVVNVSQKNKISLWTSKADNSEAIMDIGRKLRQQLKIPTRLHYQVFATRRMGASAYSV